MGDEVASTLKGNGIAIVATDTLYGVLGDALNKDVVQRIYDLKGRDENKPFIILIHDITSLEKFGVQLSPFEKEKITAWWPGAVTVILPVAEDKQQEFSYLHRGTNELAFRMPNKESLLELLQETGPLVAPSANPEGKEPAHTIAEAKEYFGENIDWYEDEGEVNGQASTIVRLTNDTITVIRQGKVFVV